MREAPNAFSALFFSSLASGRNSFGRIFEVLQAAMQSRIVAPLTLLLSILLLGSATMAELNVSESSHGERTTLMRKAFQAKTDGQEARADEVLAELLQRWPDYEPARWLAGQVKVAGKWLAARSAMNRKAWDLAEAEYSKLRDQAISAEDEARLAQWAERHEQADRARFHYRRVLARQDASADLRAQAAGRLNLTKIDGMWMTGAEAEEYQETKERTLASLKQWIPRLAHWQAQLVDAQRDPDRLEGVTERIDGELKQLTQAELWGLAATVRRVAAQICSPLAEMLVNRLAGEPDGEAARALCELALGAPTEAARDAAIQALRERRLEDSIPYLIQYLRDPIATRFLVWRDYKENLYLMRDALMPGEAANQILRQLDTVFAIPRVSEIDYDEDRGRLASVPRKVSTLDRQIELLKLGMRTAQWQSTIAAHNRKLAMLNQVVFTVLEEIVGTRPPRMREAWIAWWDDYRSSHRPMDQKPTYVSTAATVDYYEPDYVLTPIRYGIPFRTSSCFHAGTPVWTETGLLPIEKVRPGDRVLSRDIRTGELSFQLVTAVTSRPPAEMLTVRVDGDSITATLGHVFWIAGKGWTMTRQLPEAARLSGVERTHSVQAVEPALPSPAYNLVVDGTHTYFVGKAGLLVHDNTLEESSSEPLPGFRFISSPAR